MSGVGISFGNTAATVAICRDGRTEVIANSAGERATATIVAFQEGDILTGTPAYQLANRQPQHAARHLKCLLGRRLEDVHSSVQTCKLEEHNSEIVVNFSNTARKGVCALVKSVFDNLKETADSILGESAHETVIAVPYNASPLYKSLVSKCAASAGFHVVDTVPEPIAALLTHPPLETGHSVVLRVGGKSSSATLVHSLSGLYSVVDHLDADIGGQSFDLSIGRFLCQEFNRKHRCKVEDNARSFTKILKASEQVKCRLSTRNISEVSIESLFDGYDFCTSLSRPRFETLIQSDLSKILTLVKEITQKHADKGISKIVLSGGSSKVTKFQSLIKDSFPSVEVLCATPEENISLGAAAHVASRHPSLNSDLEKDGTVGVVTCSSDLQAQVDGNVTPVFEKHTPLPHTADLTLPEGENFVLLADGVCIARAKLPEEGGKFSLHVEVSEDSAMEVVLKDCSSNERTTFLVPAPVGA